MNLSLCPNCAAKYRAYRNDDRIMRNFWSNIKSASYNADKPQAQLEGETAICFTKAHLAELQTILTEMENE
jgi:anti-sigma factor RsiW